MRRDLVRTTISFNTKNAEVVTNIYLATEVILKTGELGIRLYDLQAPPKCVGVIPATLLLR